MIYVCILVRTRWRRRFPYFRTAFFLRGRSVPYWREHILVREHILLREHILVGEHILLREHILVEEHILVGQHILPREHILLREHILVGEHILEREHILACFLRGVSSYIIIIFLNFFFAGAHHSTCRTLGLRVRALATCVARTPNILPGDTQGR